MADVKAINKSFTVSVTSDGNDNNVIISGQDALGDGAGWIDVRAYTTGTIKIQAAGGSGCSFTLNGKMDRDANSEVVTAKGALATGAYLLDGTAATGTALNIIHLSYLQIKEDGTNTEAQEIVACFK